MSTTAQTHAARAMAYAFARNVASMQAAYIEWTRGDGADHGMAWISNTLCGPGLLPDAGSATAQEFFDCEMEKLDKLYPDVTMNPPIPSPAWCASVDAELAATAEADAQPVEVQRVPLTKAEIERIYHRYGGDMMNCTRAIERAFDAKVARTVGLTPEQLEEIAKAIYAASKSYLWMANSCYEELTPDDQEICREMGRAAHGIFPANSESPTLPAAAVAEGAQLDGESLEQAE